MGGLRSARKIINLHHAHPARAHEFEAPIKVQYLDAIGRVCQNLPTELSVRQQHGVDGEEVPYSVTMDFYNSRRVPRRLQDPILEADLKELALRLSPRMLLRVMPRLRRNSPGVCPVQRRKARTKWLGSA